MKLLDIGLEGVIDEAQRNLALLREDDPEYLEKKAFLESVVICMQGALDYADRLAKLAFEKAKSAPDAGTPCRIDGDRPHLCKGAAQGAGYLLRGVAVCPV